MATQSKKYDTYETPVVDSIKELGFDVIVEQVIGTVVPDYDTLKNGRTTTEAAFELIAKHVDSNSEPGSPFVGGTFRFDLGDVVYTIDVTSFDRSESA